MAPDAVERAAFSPATAWSTISRKRRSSFSSSAAEAERRSTSIVTALAMALIEVPPETTLTQCVVGGSAGTGTAASARAASAIAYIGFTSPKAAQECPPGPRKVTR